MQSTPKEKSKSDETKANTSNDNGLAQNLPKNTDLVMGIERCTQNDISNSSANSSLSSPSISISNENRKRNAHDILMKSSTNSTRRRIFSRHNSINSITKSTSSITNKSDDFSITSSSDQTQSTVSETVNSTALKKHFNETGASNKKFKRYGVPHPDFAEKYNMIRRPNSLSKVWNYFHVFKSCEPGKCPDNLVGTHGCWAVCNDCGKILTYHSVSKDGIETSTTSSVNVHLKSCHKISKLDIERGVGSSNTNLIDGTITTCFDKFKGNKWKSAEEKDAAIKKLTTYWICEELLPFRVVESESFRRMIHVHNSKARYLTNKSIKEEMIDIEKEIRTYLVQHLKKLGACVSLTIDHWTSCSKQNFTGMC